jgi:hypothetical protein
VFSVGPAPRLYKADPRRAEDNGKVVGVWHCSLAPQGRLRRDGAIIELTFDKRSSQAAVTTGPERGKLKNFYC